MNEQNNEQENEENNTNETIEKLTSPSQIKKYFLYIMIGGLVVSAAISIMAVLIGDFNDYIQKSLLTTFSIVVHSMLALAFVSVNIEHRSKTDGILLNTLFGIVVASFATSILALWDLITGPVIGDLYLTYLYALIAALLCRALLQSNRVDKNTRMLADSSVAITVFLFLILLPSVFVNFPSTLPDMYYRVIAATAILLGTSSVLTAIMHRLYISKHPESHIEEPVKKPTSALLKIVVFLVVFLYVAPLLVSFISQLFQ